MAESQADQGALKQGRNFVWHEVAASDMAATIAFYTENLQFGSTVMEMGEMGSYTMLTRDGAPVCGVTQAPEGVGAHWATYLSVDDVDARLAKCLDAGATLLMEPHDVPTVGRMAYIQDPQGARLWLFKGEGGM